MGRNIKPEAQAVVPVNGAVYRNTATNSIIVDATGAQYAPSNGSGVFSATDYPKFVSLNTPPSAAPANYSVGSSYSSVYGGVLSSSYVTPSYTATEPYLQTTFSVPFSGQSSKLRFIGATASSGSYVVTMFTRLGYRQSQSTARPAVVFNTSGVVQTVVTDFGVHAWYDTSTSTYRVLGATAGSGATLSLYTSSDALSWTRVLCGNSGTNALNYTYTGDSTNSNMAVAASNQKVFAVLLSSTTNNYALHASTDGGANFTERSTAVTGTADSFFGLNKTYINVNLAYDGTTLFVPQNSAWRYSTNDGVAFSNTTVSGVTTGINNNMSGAIQGGNSSTWMYLYNGSVTNSHVYVTTNGGQTFTSYSWTPVGTLNSSYYLLPGDYDSVNSRWCFIYISSSGTYAATSTNNGATWTHSKISSLTSYSTYFYCAHFGDAFYCNAGSVVYRSTDGATWTAVVGNVTFPAYGQPYWSLTDYVVFGDQVIKKSDQTTKPYNRGYLMANLSGNVKTFGNYITSDLFVQAQTILVGYTLATSSSNVFTAGNYSPYPYSGQQTANNANTIEYWRIK